MKLVLLPYITIFKPAHCLVHGASDVNKAISIKAEVKAKALIPKAKAGPFQGQGQVFARARQITASVT